MKRKVLISIILILIAILCTFLLQNYTKSKVITTNTSKKTKQNINKSTYKHLKINHQSFLEATKNVNYDDWKEFRLYSDSNWSFHHPQDWKVFGENNFLEISKNRTNIIIYFRKGDKTLEEYTSNAKIQPLNNLNAGIGEDNIVVELPNTFMEIEVTKILRGEELDKEVDYSDINEAFEIINTLQNDL